MSFASPTTFIPSFGLRLLDASRCPNITSSSLAQALSRFEGLLYLDLSFTYPARDQLVLRAFRRFAGLQVLKLRGISLTDEALAILAPAIRRRVRSLDIRNNQISDRGVRILLEECFTINSQGTAGSASRSRSPGLVPYMGHDMLDIYQSENFEGYLRNAFTCSFVGRQAFEDAPEGGITHLYIAKNKVSAEGAAGLLRSGRLHVLDLESVASKLGRHLSNSGYDGSHNTMEMPGVEKLAPVVATCAAKAMTFLRIDHRLISKNITSSSDSEQLVDGRVELPDTELASMSLHAVEIDSRPDHPDIAELPGVQTPRFEAVGDSMALVISAPNDDPPPFALDDEVEPQEVRRGSIYAPEVVESNAESPGGEQDQSACDPRMVAKLRAEEARRGMLSPVSSVEDGTMTYDTTSGSTYDSTLISPLTNSTGSTIVAQPVERPSARLRSYSSVADERKARLERHMASNQNLHPAMLPHVKELVLTDVPPFESDSCLVDRFKTFIRQCAEEAALAKKQATLDYALPPGRRGHANALKQSADKAFALKRIVLELAADDSSSPVNQRGQWQSANNKSMTDDRDSESLWAAAETDFSFFGDDDHSFPSLDPDRYANPYGSSEKEMSFGQTFTPQPNKSPAQPVAPPKYETVALLSAFRRERKEAYQRLVNAGAEDPEVEGYWAGVISVIRPDSGLRYDEEIDYYGNRFQKGYLYP